MLFIGTKSEALAKADDAEVFDCAEKISPFRIVRSEI
jgi:hypothetical protein